MRLFSEEVTPTFTNSNLNIITVKDFYEVFFDVYALEINGKKYVTEKIDEYKGSPVINLPVEINGKKYNSPFVLQRGKFNILYNENNSTYIKDVVDDSDDLILEEQVVEEVEEIIFEKKETILEDIRQAKISAKEYLDKLKQQQIDEVNSYQSQKQAEFDNELKVVKEGLVEEFVRIASNIKSDIDISNNEISNKLKKLISIKVSKLTDIIEQNIETQREELEDHINETVNTIASNIISSVIATEIKASNIKLDENIDGLYNHISLKLVELVNEHKSSTEAKLDGIISTVDKKLLTVEKVAVELNDNITKSSNRALSRIGNVKTKLEEDISKNVSLLQHDIEVASDRIRTFYDNKLVEINENISTLSDSNKQECIKLISESKDSLLKVISEIKVDVPNIIVEQKDGTGKEIDIKKVKSELEKSISSRFTNEISSLKRMMEMMSGGGSVAQQFANGGTMNGDLTITGAISASSYLGIPEPDLTQYLPISGGTVTGNLTVTGTLSATLLEALSANITVIDIKQYELSGFNVQGDATVQGSISASGNVTGSNLVYNGGNTTTTPLSVGTINNTDLIFETNGVERMKFTVAGSPQTQINNRLTVVGGVISLGSIQVAGSNNFQFDSRGIISTPSNGVMLLRNWETTNFDRLQFGGTTSAFPAIKRNGSGIDIVNADNTNFTDLRAANATLSSVNIAGNLIVDTTTLVVDSVNNRVGIGTSSPSVPLDVVGDASGRLARFTHSTSAAVFLNRTASVYNGFGFQFGGNERWFVGEKASSDDFVIRKGGATDFVTVSYNTGRVGIGTTSPSTGLHLAGNDSNGRLRIQSLNDNPVLEMQSNAGISYLFTNNGDWHIRTDTVTRHVKLQSGTTDNGYVQIGGKSLAFGPIPDSQLTVTANTNDSNFGILNVKTYDSTSRFYVRSDGNVGIGTTTPNERLTVSGNISASGSLSAIGIKTRGLEFTPRSAQNITQTVYSDLSDELYVGSIASGKRIHLGSQYTHVRSNMFSTNKLYIGSDSSIYANSNNPVNALTVNGTISASGVAYANGAKLASENFAVAMAIALG